MVNLVFFEKIIDFFEKNYWQILNLIYNSHIENANICLIVVGG